MRNRMPFAAAGLLLLTSSVPALAQQGAAAEQDQSAMSAADETVVAPPAGRYVFEPDHSQIVFEWDHLGLSTSRAMVRGVSGEIMLDPEQPEASAVEAWFSLDAVTTLAPGLDAHLRTADFFDVQGAVPEIRFRSTSVEPGEGATAAVRGDLTLNGQTAPVTLDVRYRGTGVNPATQQQVVGFEAEGEILRSQFGLGAFVPAVGDTLSIQIAVEAAPAE